MRELFDEWLEGVAVYDAEKQHVLAILAENHDIRQTRFNEILDIMRVHYVDAKTAADRLAELGASSTATLLREKLPKTKRARSGEMGEIITTEIAERRMKWRVPVRRLRWKDGREMALRGDDLTAIKVENDELVAILKGESKSRAGSFTTALSEAVEALDRDGGRPNRLSVLFVAEQLRRDDPELALMLERAVLASFSGLPIEHMLLVLTGTDPSKNLRAHVLEIRGKGVRRNVVGVKIEDHAEFIKSAYEAL